jgi:hypothetical protein
MRRTRHFVEWNGVRYTAEPLKPHTRVSSLPPVWAISRGQEFIGTLPIRSEETTKEFEARCIDWLRDLLGPAHPTPHARQGEPAPRARARGRGEPA